MSEAALLKLITLSFGLAQAKVEYDAVVARLQGVPPEKYPDILDAMYAESKLARDEATK
jgi:hypothetical protein